MNQVTKTADEWRKSLTPQQFNIMRQKGTEPAFSGAYWNHHDSGTYRCAGCGTSLFSSKTKFDSGTGWPSFWAAVSTEAVQVASDTSLGITRTEVLCRRCESHLGHVFPDGPEPSGKRYCINSAALNFERDSQK